MNQKRLDELTEAHRTLGGGLCWTDLDEFSRLQQERIEGLERLVCDWGRSVHDMPFQPRECKCPECIALEDEATAIHMRQHAKETP